MGEFRFRIPSSWDFQTRHARTVHVVGIDGIPRPCNVRRHDDQLVIKRNQNESGRTYISFPFRARGELTICTGTLKEAEQPYDLVIELARGTINRLRNQTSIWQEGGLNIPEHVRQLTRIATSKLGKAITCPETDSEENACDALNCAIDAVFELCEQFGKDISEFRVSESEIPAFWMGVPNFVESAGDSAAESTSSHNSSFDLLALSIDEALNTKTGFGAPKLLVGPLLDASPMSNFSTMHEDFNSGRLHLLNQCDVLLDDLPTGTTLIHAASNLNGIGHKNLSYRQQVQLTTELVGRIDDSQHDLPVMISFDYPWAERLAWSVGGIHPLQIADDIMRNGTRISFVGLDINLDYWPCGSVARDPLQWIDMIDLWCQLGLPLVLCLRVPQPPVADEPDIEETEFQSNHDENVTIAIETVSVDESGLKQESVGGNTIRENLNETQRLELLKTILPMAVARPGVHGIFWRQWNDGQDSRFPMAGLTSDFGIEKPTLGVIEDLRINVLHR